MEIWEESMIILKVVSLIVWLLIVPFCMGLGLLPLLEKRLRTPGVALVGGYILLFTLLELVGIPVTLLCVYNGFTTFTIWFTLLISLSALGGVLVTYRRGKRGQRIRWIRSGVAGEMPWEGRIFWLFFIALVSFQLYMAFTRASFDGDDAYYGVQALIAQQVDTLYRINPYTGRSAPLDVRHGLALFPVWEAYIGRMSGVHATIVSHSVVPLILIPLTYILYYQTGRVLFHGKKRQLPMFMTLMALWQMFGNISLYTTETFFLTRTWQGKSFAGNFVIPAVIWLFLCLFDEGERKKKAKGRGGAAGKETSGRQRLWLLLACLNFAGGASSSLAILLSCLMTMGFGMLFAIREKKPIILLKAGGSCVPGGAYIMLYLALTHGILAP